MSMSEATVKTPASRPAVAHAPAIRRLTIQLTRFCNLNCYYCYCHPRHGKNTDGVHYPALIEFLNKALPFANGAVTLTGGEPLIYSHIDGLLEFLGRARQKIALETNGTYLSLERLGLLSVAGAHVAVTLESVNPAIHDSIRGKKGSWAKSVEALARAAHTSSVTTQITSTSRLGARGMPSRFVIWGNNSKSAVSN